MLAPLSLFMLFLGVAPYAINPDFNALKEKPFLEPGSIYDAVRFGTPVSNKNIGGVSSSSGSSEEPGSDSSEKSQKETFDENLLAMEDPVPTDDNTMQKRLYIQRDGFRPAKRSMAIGRAGMRPGKRAFGSSAGKGFSDNYYPLDRFSYFDE